MGDVCQRSTREFDKLFYPMATASLNKVTSVLQSEILKFFGTNNNLISIRDYRSISNTPIIKSIEFIVNLQQNILEYCLSQMLFHVSTPEQSRIK